MAKSAGGKTNQYNMVGRVMVAPDGFTPNGPAGPGPTHRGEAQSGTFPLTHEIPKGKSPINAFFGGGNN
jgi:hypothetical protein